MLVTPHPAQAEPDRVLTVVRADHPDEVFEFAAEGSSRLFGRDERACDIVIGTVVDVPLLSRVAGRIWRMQGELWVRNLSTTHELYLSAPGGPPEPPLPPRHDSPGDPGPARSIPGPAASITAPGGCELVVAQVARELFRQPLAQIAEATLNLPPVPAPLRPVAAALCEPLLLGGQLPATYGEVASRAGTGSPKRARTLVGELCALYTAELPVLGDRVRAGGSSLAGPAEHPVRRTLRGGVWVFDPVPGARSDPAGERDRDDEDDAETTRARRRSLSLPDYYEVAHLLVRRRLVTAADVRGLGEAVR